MHSEFSSHAKRARAQLPAPDAPVSSILSRSAALKAKQKVRAIVLTCAISLAMVGTAAAFGAQVFSGVKLWLSGDSATIVIHSFAVTREPTFANVRRIVSNATFPITLPVGLPPGTHVHMIMYAPANRPNVITIMYRNDHGLNAGFSIFDTKAIASGPPPIPGYTSANGVHWTVGAETVFGGTEARKYLNLPRIQSAMAASSPEKSLAAIEPMLSKATVLGANPDLGRIAARYAPASGNAVVLGSFFVKSIPALAKSGKPLIGSNTTLLTHIPSVSGAPDYKHATLQFSRDVALAPQGVKAVAAVMRYGRIAPNCVCSMVVDRQASNTYDVWSIPSGRSATKYAVDAHSLKVTELTQ